MLTRQIVLIIIFVNSLLLTILVEISRRLFLINLRIDPLIQGALCLRIHTVLLGIAISAALKIVFVTLSTD
jgi:hypothetical protein